jgi:hypothetical protein
MIVAGMPCIGGLELIATKKYIISTLQRYDVSMNTMETT